MRGGWIGTLGVLTLLLFATGTRGEGESLFLDGHSLELASPPIHGEHELLVPIREVGPLIGIEVGETSGGSLELRWSHGRLTVETARLHAVDGIHYTSLDWLVELAGGLVRRLGSSVFVDSDPVPLDELDVTENRIVLRFGGFVPIETVLADERAIRLRFHHCEAPFPHRSVIVGEGPMTRVDAQAAVPSALDIAISLREVGAIRLTRIETDDAYAVTIEIAEEAFAESAIELSGDRTLHELEITTEAGISSLVYTYVDAWRSSYRTRPSGSSFELGDLALVSQLALAETAEVAIGAGQDLGLLVVDGVPFHVPAEPSTLLVADAFGRLSSVEGQGRIVLDVEGVDIPIDDVNRPTQYGEAIAYPPGYRGEIAAGAAGGFTVLKIRSGCVVSVYQGSFVDQDPTATLIVASGEARARFAGITLGDDAHLACYVDALSEPLASAMSIETVLLRDGVRQDLNVADGSAGTRAWSVVATDWHGGLILLSALRNERSAGLGVAELLAFLEALPVPVDDAFALGSGGASAIAVDAGGLQELGDDARVAVALLLVSLGE